MSEKTLPEDVEFLYRRMAVIRAFEDSVLDLAEEGLIAGSVHTCQGQEAIPVGVTDVLGTDDRVLSTYRGHGWAIARGVPLAPLMGEIAQRQGGINGGRGGSPYFFAPDFGFFGENSIVGAGVAISSGVALASKYREEGRVVVTSIGDGAMNQGSVHEAFVFAAAQKLPLVIICENNGWSEMTRTESLLRNNDFGKRVEAYGITVIRVDGGDPVAVREAARQAVNAARSGNGPVFLDCETVRLRGHYNKDVEHYRPEEDSLHAKSADPLARMRRQWPEATNTFDAIDESVRVEVGQATAEAREMPAPDPDCAALHVYGPQNEIETQDTEPDDAIEMPYVIAVNAALRDAMTDNPDVIVYGEDVGNAGGIFGATRGLQRRFGEGRIFDTPISESAILGSAVGAAMAGLRPVVEVMWADFMLVALDQLVNQAANVRYVTSGKLQAPIVVRTQQGVTPGSCAQHSQSLEALLAHVPGLRVGVPSNAQDAYSMLRAAIDGNDPCVLFESRALYPRKADVRKSSREAVGGARFLRHGRDVVLIGWGAVIHEMVEAADQLSAQGIEATVMDLRWLSPIDEKAIAQAVHESSGHVAVVHEANVTGGFGAEISSRITERHFLSLAGPVERIGTPDVRMPSAPALQEALVPTASSIVERVHLMLGDGVVLIRV